MTVGQWPLARTTGMLTAAVAIVVPASLIRAVTACQWASAAGLTAGRMLKHSDLLGVVEVQTHEQLMLHHVVVAVAPHASPVAQAPHVQAAVALHGEVADAASRNPEREWVDGMVAQGLTNLLQLLYLAPQAAGVSAAGDELSAHPYLELHYWAHQAEQPEETVVDLVVAMTLAAIGPTKMPAAVGSLKGRAPKASLAAVRVPALCVVMRR